MRGLIELLCLVYGVLPGGCVQHEQGFARCVRQLARDDAVDLGQLVHQVGLVVQTARGVHDDDIAAARLGRGDRVKYDRRRIGALAVTHDVRTRAFCPDFKLVSRRRAEGVRRTQHDLFALADIAGCQLADRRGLAHAVDADHQDDRGLTRNVQRLVVQHVVGQHLAQQVAQLRRGGNLPELCALFHLGDDLRGGFRAHVGQDKRFFQLFEQIRVDLDERREHVVQRAVYRVAGFL